MKDAIAAVLDGRPVDRPEVKAVGCPLPEPAASSASANYHRDLEPILQVHCQVVPPGAVAPFSLLTFDQARKRTTHDLAAAQRPTAGCPLAGVARRATPFRDARLLSPKEIGTLEARADAGAPEEIPETPPPPELPRRMAPRPDRPPS